MASRAGRTAFERGQHDGRGAAPIEPPKDAVAKAVSQDSLAAGDEAFSQTVPVVKSTNEAGDFLLFGVVMRPNAVDAHGEVADFPLVRKASHDFLAGYGTATGMGVQHQEFDHPIELVESTIETVDHEKHGLQVYAGDWTVTTRVNSDSLKEQVTKSALTGFSIGGFGAKAQIKAEDDQPIAKSLDGATRQAVAKFTRLAVHEISLVDSPANEITFVIAKRRSKEDEMKTQTEDQAAALAAAQAEAADLKSKLETAEAALAVAKAPADPATSPAPVTPTEPAKPENDAPAAKPADVADAPASPAPVAKAKRFTKGRAAALKTLQEQQAASAKALADLLADLDGEADDGTEVDSSGPEVITKAAVDIDAAIAKALKPITDETSVLKQKLAAAEAELEVVKNARLPATSRNGSTVTKQRDREDLWDNLV